MTGITRYRAVTMYPEVIVDPDTETKSRHRTSSIGPSNLLKSVA